VLAMRRLLPWVLASLMPLSACRTAVAPAVPVAGAAAASRPTPMAAVDHADGLAISVQAPEALPTANTRLPEQLQGQPYGLLSVAIAWPQSSGARRPQAIPTQARSIRMRVIGSDGKVRLSDFYFNTGRGSVNSKTYALKAETGMLVEVRAYLESQADLEKGPAVGQTFKYANEGGVEPQFNAGQVVGKEYNMAGRRVLAEGLKANFQVVLFSRNPVNVSLDSSQLVAGIGGSPAWSLGGDPFFPNFVSAARFAELANPRNLYLDTWNGRRRLFFNVNPTFDDEDPKERHIVMMLDQAGLEAVQTDVAARATPVLKQVFGGARLLDPGDLREQPLRNRTFGDFTLSTFRLESAAGSAPQLVFNSILDGSRSFASLPAASLPVIQESTSSSSPINFGSSTLSSSAVDFSGFASGQGGAGLLIADPKAVYEILDAPLPALLAAGSPAPTATPDATSDVEAKKIVLPDNEIVAVAGMTRLPKTYAFATKTALLYGVADKVRLVLGSPSATSSLENASAGTGVGRFDFKITLVSDVVASPAAPSVLYVAADNKILRVVLPADQTTMTYTSDPMEVFAPGFLPQSLAVSPDGTQLAVVGLDGRLAVFAVAPTPAGASTWAPQAIASVAKVRRVEFVPAPGPSVLLAFTNDGVASQIKACTVGAATSSNLLDGRSVYDSRIGDGNRIIKTMKSVTEGGGHIDKPAAISVTPGGSVLVADPVIKRIRHLDMPADTQGVLESLVTSVPDANPPSHVLDAPEGVDTDKFGTVFIADSNNYHIRIWKPSCGFGAANIPIIAGSGQQGYNLDNINARLVQLGKVTRIKVERSTSGRRRIFFIDGKRVRMLSPRNPSTTSPLSTCDGPPADPYFQYIVSSIAGDGTGTDKTNAAQFGLTAPTWLDVDARGYVYVADGKTIFRIDPDAGTIVPAYTAEDAAITSFVIDDQDPRVREVYVTKAGNQTIRKLILED